jgi:hypothetical protein
MPPKPPASVMLYIGKKFAKNVPSAENAPP